MSSSREDSPDWLRTFQAETHSTLVLSSDSDSLNASASSDDKIDCRSPESESGAQSLAKQVSKPKAPKRGPAEDETLIEKKRRKKSNERLGDEADGQATEKATKHTKSHAADSIWELSSDSESFPDDGSQREAKQNAVLPGIKSPSKKATKKKSPKKMLKADDQMLKKEGNKKDSVPDTGYPDDVEVADGDVSEKPTAQVSTSRIPLLLSDKVSRTKALVECEGESIDLSGDMGAVGRVVIPDNSSANHEMYLDLKGTIYQTKIVPSRTFCIVSFGQSEAKIEAIMNDFIQLKAQSNVYEAETMVEGTLEGYSFDSEDEAEKIPKPHQTDQNEGNEEQINGKSKGKAKKGMVKKKGKTGGGKTQPAKRVRKKAQAPKKAKTKK
ncbi:DNA-binding protein BIN4 [Mercurialis annua]|uniref:DNA-binding protein BIN4 n=1 Tax=Mercurialis annua TaxID=3986 RepID=UPI00215F59F3|nr:DNA-binding protein BIN4 [Mercurialis annua]